MIVDPLELLVTRAAAFAKAYTAVVEALVKEGVREDVARNEGRQAAFLAAVMGPQERDHLNPWEKP